MRRSLAGLSMAHILAACSGEEAPTSSAFDAANFKLADAGVAGAMYVVSNDASANAILVYPRAADGTLADPTAVATGGQGTGAGLGNQAAIALDTRGTALVSEAVGGAPDASVVSSYRFGASGLVGVSPSTATLATPLDAGISRNGRFLYTLDAGGQAISMLRIGSDGSLTHLGDLPGVPAGATGLVSQ